jgi:hypothetical protein
MLSRPPAGQLLDPSVCVAAATASNSASHMYLAAVQGGFATAAATAALLVCCKRGAVADVRVLLAVGISPTAESPAVLLPHTPNGHRQWRGVMTKQTAELFPLAVASDAGHVDVVRLLLEQRGVDPNQASTGMGHTALFCACRSEQTEVARLLLQCTTTNTSATTASDSTQVVDVNRATSDQGGYGARMGLFFECIPLQNQFNEVCITSHQPTTSRPPPPPPRAFVSRRKVVGGCSIRCL